jgi:menaquinone-dependent protoporphyrinogen IX oxidase
MTRRIRVACATRGGSTAGVAEAIGHSLAEDGWSADVLPTQSAAGVLLAFYFQRTAATLPG